jgi:hypothetical protein
MRAERAVLGGWAATGLGVAGVLVPKCPLCAAAYLGLLGLGAGSARTIVNGSVPLCLGLLFTSALGTAFLVARRRRRAGTARDAQEPLVAPARSSCCRAG